jgi:hypothetical protein
LPGVVKGAAAEVADRFLEPIGVLITEFQTIKDSVQDHDLKLKRLHDRMERLERELADVRMQVASMQPKSVDP